MPDLSPNDKILDRLVGHHVEVLRLAGGLSSQVQEILEEADDQTYQTIIDRARVDDTVSHSRVNALLSEVRRINLRAWKDVARLVASELTGLATYEAEVLPRMFERALPLKEMGVRSVPKYMTSAIVHEEPMAGGLLEEWAAGLADGRFSRIRAAIRLGVAGGESVSEIVRRIRGSRKTNYRDGIARVSHNSARAMVQTAVNAVANSARKSIFQANKPIVTHVMWSAVLDDDTCPQCAGLDGELFRLSEMPEVPLHLNCRCMLTPIFGPVDDDEWEDLFDAPMPRPRKLLYRDWLRRQTETTQNKILGRERAALFRRGMPLDKFTDQSGLRYSLPELRAAEATMASPREPRRSSTQVRVLKNFGWKPDLPDQRDKLFAAAEPTKIAIPSRISLRDGMPPVFDQGNLGSCTANAAVAAHMYLHRGLQMMSRLDLYWSTRYIEGTTDEDSGASIRDTVKALAKYGVCSEATWPYKVRKFRTDPPATADKEAREYRITSYHRLLSHEDFMRCLAQGRPFIFGFSVYDNIFERLCVEKAILLPPSPSAQLVGGHAVLCVGVDQNFHENPVFKKSGLSREECPNFMYEIRNSWGPQFADAGYFWMDARLLEDRNVSDDFWAIRA